MHKIEYDAFISYKHNTFDSAIAERLHKKLERYHIPRIVQQMTGQKRIVRVFRDKEELPLTSDLTKNIYEALDHAKCLIVICSPASKESLWIQREVAYYVSKHGKDRVMTVLTDGEPEMSFPEILCSEDGGGSAMPREPLAADVRAPSLKQSLRQLNREFLRLVAAIIDCPYDGLKRRHRAYRIKCISAISLLVLSVMAGVFAFTIHKNRQVFQYRQATLQKEGELLADQSMQTLRKGRRGNALSLALEMSALDETNTYQSPLQAYALNNALYTYRSPYYKEYVPVAESQFSNIDTGCFSLNGQFYYALTRIVEYGNEKNIYVYSGENGDFLYQIDTAPICEAIEKLKEPFRDYWSMSGDALIEAMDLYFLYSNSYGDIQYVIPYSDTNLLLILDNAACLYDAESREILCCFLMPSGTIQQYNYGHVYQSDSGELYYYVKSSQGEGFCYDISNRREISYEILEQMGLSHLFKFEDQSVCGTVISDTRQAVLLHQEPERQIKAIDGREYDIFYPALYDSEQGRFLWTGKEKIAFSASSSGAYAGIRFFELSDEDMSAEYIVYWINKTLVFLDVDSGNALAEISFNSNIRSVERGSDDSVMVGIASGIVQEIGIYGDLILQNDRLWLSAELSCMDYNPAANTIAVVCDGRVIFSKITGDDNMNVLNLQDAWDLKLDSIQYSESDEAAYRILCGKINGREALLIYPTLSDACVYQYIAEDETTKICNARIISRNGREVLIVVAYSSENYRLSYVHEIDLGSGNELNYTDIASTEIEYFNDFSFSQDYDMLICLTYDGEIVTIPLDTEEPLSEPVQVLPDGVGITACAISATGKSVVFVCEKSVHEPDTKELYVYHSDSGRAEKLDYTFQTKRNIYIENGLFTERMALAFGNEIIVLDTAHKSVICHIKTAQSSDEWIRCAFFDQDQSLLVATDKEVLLYEVASGNLLNSWSIDIVDEYTADLYQYDLVVDKSSDFFALKDSAFISSYDGAWGKKPLIVCYVDDQQNIIPYAKINYGQAHLNSGEIASYFSKYVQYAPLYDVETLRTRAEAILEERS